MLARKIVESGAATRVRSLRGPFSEPRSELSLDEDHEGFGQHAVVRHRLRRALGLHRAHERVHVGDVHQHSNTSPVLRVDERPDVGDTEGPEELVTLRLSLRLNLGVLVRRPS
jgi:hypothetical protein